MAQDIKNEETRSMIDTEVDDTGDYLGSGDLSGWKHEPRLVMLNNSRMIVRNGDMLFEK